MSSIDLRAKNDRLRFDAALRTLDGGRGAGPNRNNNAGGRVPPTPSRGGNRPWAIGQELGINGLPQRRDEQRLGGFTLMEIMVVIVIIGLLAGATTIAVRSYLHAGRRGTAKFEIANIKKAVETYHSVYGKYPTQDQGLAALQKATADYPDGFLENDLNDPWNHPYGYYLVQGKKDPFEIVCYGADGQPGGSAANADISSLQLGTEPQ